MKLAGVDGCGQLHDDAAVAICIKIDAFCTNNDEICIKDDALCIENDDLNANGKG